MKLYRVVWRDGVWHVLGGEPEHAIAASDDRDALILLARRVAAGRKGELYVYDKTCALEFAFLYTEAIESLHETISDSPRLVRFE